ncbi:exodeoxyribonuclease V subunit beta [uncultured Neptuniibacter sp.]|uniref:exodeoxyribonuclease V subunit beta n=1 Tax=uncultured Neptuniibacter sp. TaxID=502143 RepID=UPI00260DCB52|nr:exodeoxyribonuclease V subunit beta [uncultured Neptuniibacter sp.]
MTKVNALNPLTFPLQGQQLIEASAGTGKTYTITALYLRLLLGLGNINDRPLGPDQILVVTFTEAATEELRDRIRARISDARTAFLQSDVKDPLLQALKRQVDDSAQAVKLLEHAIRQMDEAAIFTIHGFCQRMLKQHAFESGSLFETELTQDDLSLIRGAALDFWRSTIYPLNGLLTELVFEHCWKTPEQLIAELRGLLSRQVILQPDLSDQDLLQVHNDRIVAINTFKQAWLECTDDLFELIQTSGINKRSYNKNNTRRWLDRVSEYAQSDQHEPDKKLSEMMQKLAQTSLQEKTDKGEAPEHPLFLHLERLLAESVPVREILLSRALKQVKHRLALAKQQYQLQTFDDLLIGLNSALHAEQGELLCDAIRQQFPVAMIDEFQDTDPLQYGIFSRLYSDPYRTALVMIGDPKQAIYAFRGADIFTYIHARRAVSETYTLDTNWRSTHAMVESVNTLFRSAQSAFIYDDDIPFIPVKAADKTTERLKIQSVEPPALTLWYQPSEEPLSKGQYTSVYAQATAAEIDRLMAGEAMIGERAVQGSDIAVLVRDRFEAEEIRRALSVYEHPCVYLSNQDSVFNSLEALELALTLAAIENPQNERGLRAALATELFQLDMHALDQLNHDENLWEDIVAEFNDYREQWVNRGVLPMLRKLLHRRNLASKTLENMAGERRLTNLLHLAELLQQASSEVESINGLIRWFNEQIASSDSAADEQVIRLESERNLVTIVTIYKSKGLEYPIVFLPFASSFREQKTAFYHNDAGEAVLDISADPEALAEADQERLAEELRLLYVALTRSVYSCYVGVSHLRIGNAKRSRLQDSALGYLLLQSGMSLEDALDNLTDQQSAIQVILPPDHGAQKDLFATSETAEVSLKARAFNQRIERDWRVSSYSALSRHAASSLPVLPGLDLEVADEQTLPVTPEGVKNIFTFPKGAHAGTFLHSVFEEISFTDYMGCDRQRESYQQQLEDQLLLAGYDPEWLPVIDKLIVDVLGSHLDSEGLSLAQVADRDLLVEMEFMISAEQLTVSALETLIRKYDPLAVRARPLAFEPLSGMLKGFIDLLFRHEGRYYVLDYKSNHLGYESQCYDRAAMEHAMIDHRYDLQYLLYSLAVHRLLRQRIPDYSYDHHFGGVYYLFLRGMDGRSQSGVFNTRPDRHLIEQMDRLFSGGAEDV